MASVLTLPNELVLAVMDRLPHRIVDTFAASRTPRLAALARYHRALHVTVGRGEYDHDLGDWELDHRGFDRLVTAGLWRTRRLALHLHTSHHLALVRTPAWIAAMENACAVHITLDATLWNEFVQDTHHLRHVTHLTVVGDHTDDGIVVECAGAQLPSTLRRLALNGCVRCHNPTLPLLRLPEGLTHLHLSHNRITHDDLPWLPNSLTHLDVSSTWISDAAALCSRLPPRLRHLQAHDCPVQLLDGAVFPPLLRLLLLALSPLGDLGDGFESLVNLTLLSVTVMADTADALLTLAQTLTSLTLSLPMCSESEEAEVQQTALAAMQQLPRLQQLRLWGRASSLDHMVFPSTLRALEIAELGLEHLPPLHHLHSLELLNAGSNELHRVDGLPASLLVLFLGDNHLDALPDVHMCDLRELELYGNDLVLDRLALEYLPQSLLLLDLSQNDTGAGFVAVALPHLHTLDVSDTSLTSLAQLSLPLSLRILDVSCNQLRPLAPVHLPELRELYAYGLDGQAVLAARLPESLISLDLREAALTAIPWAYRFPPDLLVLVLTSNKLASVDGWRLPLRLEYLGLDGNQLELVPRLFALPDLVARFLIHCNNFRAKIADEVYERYLHLVTASREMLRWPGLREV